MKRIVVAGSINMDIVVQAQRHPRPGETVLGDDLHFIPGGKGANQAVAASRLGGEVSLVATTGKDSFADTLRSFLSEERMDPQYVSSVTDTPTGTALIVVDKDSENAIVVVPGSNGRLSFEDIDKVDLTDRDIAVSQFETPLDVVARFLTNAREANALTILNPAPAMECPPDLLGLADYLIVNETEAAFFVGREDPPHDAVSAIELAARIRTDERQSVVVTLGAAGAVLAGRRTASVVGHDVQAVDTTGAGDCFVGAFAVALSEGQTEEEALEFANVSAAVSVQRLGASASLPRRRDVESFVDERRG
jgi:ribokinase